MNLPAGVSAITTIRVGLLAIDEVANSVERASLLNVWRPNPMFDRGCQAGMR